MLTQAIEVRPIRRADDFVAAFKDAWKGRQAAELTEFLPPPSHPGHADALRALIKVDMRLCWEAGGRRTVDHYQGLFPVAFADARFEQDLAVEEFYLRISAGESVDVAEYRDRYGADVPAWRVPPPRRGPRAGRTRRVTEPTQPRERPTTRLDEVPGAAAPAEALRARALRSAFPSAGEMFLNFELTKELGRGAFARVYLARQTDLANRYVALKVTTERDAEPLILARLQHTNIVPIYAVHQRDDVQAICMPYFGAVTLARVIRDLSRDERKLPDSGRAMLSTLFETRHTIPADGPPEAPPSDGAPAPLPDEPPTLKSLADMTQVDAALWIAARVADGLAHAHEHGILHCDLKPANILLADDGQPMLLDFNVAADRGAAESHKLRRVGGTLPYMAPEYLRIINEGITSEGAPTPRCDLYSLGVILYELLTGRPPFEEPADLPGRLVPAFLDLHSRLPPPPSRWNTSVTPAADAIVLKLLQPAPEKRYAEAAHVREDLERQLSNRPLAHARDRSPRERWRKWKRRNPRLTAAAGAALAVVLFLVLPASVIAIRHNQLAERRLQIESAEAIIAQQRAAKELKTAQVLLSTQVPDAELIRDGFDRGLAVLAEYGLGSDPDWATRPRFASLAPALQEQLRIDLGETLLLLARCELLDRPPGDPEAARAALHWNRLAEDCFPSGRRPRLLATQRAALIRVLPGAAGPLAEDKMSPDDAYHEALELTVAGRHADALLKVMPYTEAHPDHFMAWFIRGVCHEAVAQNAEAAAAFTVCATLWPEFPWTYMNRGVARLKQGRNELAEADFSRALERRPGWINALINRAIARQAKRDFGGADTDLTAALELPGCPTRCYFLRAKVRRANGDKEGAENDAKEGGKLEPADAQSWVARGVWRQPTDPHGALADYEEALKINPRSLTAFHNKAVVLAEGLNRPKEAAGVMSQLLELYPRQLEARAGRALYLARANEAEAAREEARIVLREEPSSFRFYQMAGVYAQLARRDAGGRARQEALRLAAKAFQNGFERFDLIPTDRDIAPLRDDAEFRDLVDHARKVADAGHGKNRATVRSNE